ncbi:protein VERNALIZATION INSENSITIVE [Musa troglodytarum]|uniref:Protein VERNALIZATION INSENSITIVE n=1 Tax=Musa troglodytarum TaxID=320322 RepID=A0A9E7HGZ1_9LILI|nr:protein VERNALIZATION INSENSITIVE [Musa troglodytarum]
MDPNFSEIGKERKYTSLTKQKMIEYLFRVVSDKKSGEHTKDRDSAQDLCTHSPQTPAKRQRKNDHPSRLPVTTDNLQSGDVEEASDNIRYCKNSACRATLNIEDAFCKRCWKKQLMIAKDARRVDISQTSLTVVLDLENNTLLAQEVAGFTVWHRKADTPEYPKKASFSLLNPKRRFLVTELAPATEYMFKVVAFSDTGDLDTCEVGIKTKGISLDNSMGLAPETTVLEPHCQSPKTNSSGLSNPSEGDESNTNSTACADLNKLPEIEFDECEKPEILEIEKSSDHAQKDVGHQKNECKGSTSRAEVPERDESPGRSDSALDEEPNSTIQTDSTNSMENNQTSDIPRSENESNAPVVNEMVIVPFVQSNSTLPATPCRVEAGTEGSERCSKGKPSVNKFEDGSMKPGMEPGSSSKKRCGGTLEGVNVKDRSLEGAYEYCVKVIRWLECERHIETNFRVKFLTWFSLRATPQERRIVNVYVDTLIDDPVSLAGQLVDTFSETVCSKRPPRVPTGFCAKLWH